jgi:ABC-type lipoprotein release transport system permease subunit
VTWTKLWAIGYRDLGRNRRRSIFTMLAVALGLALLIIMNGYIAGVMEDSLQNSIRLQTGHLQLRAPSYEIEELSLQWQDLLADADQVVAQAQSLPGVQTAAPVLWARAILNTANESVGLQLHGIDVTSSHYAPVRDGLVAGAYLAPDDRGGVLLGQRLADELGLVVGDNVSLTVINANNQPEEAIFAIRGLFSTGVATYDEASVMAPLARVQTFTGVGSRASAVILLLDDQEQAVTVAAALAGPTVNALTWQTMNAFFLETMQTAMSFYYILDGIVMLIVAVIVANTLLMAVFERIREMGILAALGMKGRQLMQMMLFQAAILSLFGIVVGIGLGVAGVMLLAQVGIPTGDMATVASNMAIGEVLRARLVPDQIVWLSIWTLIVALLASLYPAWFAARLEPVKALHG